MPQMCPSCGKDNRDTGRFCAYCQTQLQGLLGARSVLQNRYAVQGVLGCGGMGAVYLAFDNRLGQNQVAVKENFDTSKQAQAQFHREATVLAKLAHPNLPKVFDHFIEPTGRQYLVMEYVGGHNLETMVQKRGALPESQVLTWAGELLEALTYLHQQPLPIIHRDIKPSNVKITPDNKVKLVDFGLVKFFNPTNPHTSTSMRGLGTPEYAPPEQYDATGHTDARSDIYALGASLYHVLTGQAPPTATQRMANPAALRPPRQVNPALTLSVEAVILKAMVLPINNRFQSAKEMYQALRSPAPTIQVPIPISIPVPVPPQPLHPKRRGWPRLVTGLAVIAAVGVIGNQLIRPASTPTATPPDTTPATSIPATSLPASTTASPATAPGPGTTVSPSPTSALVAGATDTPTTPAPTPAPGALSGLAVTREASGKTGMRIEIKYADGTPKVNSWAAILAQKTDVSGNPVFGDQLAVNRTDDTGTIFFDVGPGTYALQLGDLVGDAWGSSFNYRVSNGETTVLSLTLARLVIGLRNADSSPLESHWTSVSLQKPDVSGNPVRGDRIAGTRTDNTGTVTYDLVPGTYAIDIGDVYGELWGDPMNHALPAGQTTSLVVTLGRLTVGVRDADGQPIQGRSVGVWLQRKDVSGNPVRGDQILYGWTDNTGAIAWDVTPGTYVVDIGDISGEAWGDTTNHTVTSGQATPILLTLGRLSVGLKDAGGNPIQGRYVAVYFQKKDVAGNIVNGERFLADRTDNTGIVAWDVTAGHYVVEIEGLGAFTDVPVESGRTTFSDGASVTTK